MFSYNKYRELLEKFNEYNVVRYGEEKEGQKNLILRHDVDIDINAALELAKIENEMGKKAHYFIWIGAPFYNVFEKGTLKILLEIIKLGHEIGVHIDETRYDIKNVKELINCIDKEVEIINNLLNIKVKTVSFHRPSKLILERNISLEKYENTYSYKYFNDFQYISDSGGQWRDEDIFKKIEEGKICDNIQLLTHPIWWGKKEKNIDGKIQEYIEQKTKNINENISENIKTYKKRRCEVKWEDLI